MPDASPLIRPIHERRLLTRWAVASVGRVLPIYERSVPGDTRLRDGIAGARAFARGEFTVGDIPRWATQCETAAREAADPAAKAVAHACARAVATARKAAFARQVPPHVLRATAFAFPDQPDRISAAGAELRAGLPEAWQDFVFKGWDLPVQHL